MGVPGIIILGTTGEFLTVSDEERSMFIEATVSHVAGRIPVLVGTMNAYTPRAARYSREAEELGADGLMIIPPYYYTPTDDEIFGYYQAICQATSLPIMLYNNPVTSNVDMSARLVRRLVRAFPNVQYIKEASMDIARVYDIVEKTEGRMSVFAGERIVESFLLGGGGLRQPVWELHPPCIASHLGLPRRGTDRGCESASSGSSRPWTTSSPRGIRPTDISVTPRSSRRLRGSRSATFGPR